MYSFEGKKVLITGACGTVGSALARALLSGKYGWQVEVLGVDINESEIFFIANEYRDNPNARFRLTDIRDERALNRLSEGVQVIIHAAALKHVVVCEDSPNEMVSTNIFGLQNIISAARLNAVEKIIFTSSDKAVNPSSNMGASKLLGEGLIRSAAKDSGVRGPIFASTRFGNVMGSHGSVIEIFRKQIASGLPLTLTHKEMTRFIMGISEAVALVLDSVLLAQGGEIFVTKMPVIKIVDLAYVMAGEYNKRAGLNASAFEIEEIGIKQGEKLYEELMTAPESSRAIELEKFYVIFPSDAPRKAVELLKYGSVVSHKLTEIYSSSGCAPLTHNQLLSFLQTHQLLN